MRVQIQQDDQNIYAHISGDKSLITVVDTTSGKEHTIEDKEYKIVYALLVILEGDGGQLDNIVYSTANNLFEGVPQNLRPIP